MRSYRNRKVEALDRAIMILKYGQCYPVAEDPIHVKYLEKLRESLLRQLQSNRARASKKSTKLDPQMPA